jgi:hypothetical protein
MDRLSFSTRLVSAAVGLGTLAAVSAAHARTDVHFSVGVPAAPVYVQPAPVYVQPQPVYVQPRPVYVQPRPVHVQPAPVYVQPGPWYLQPQPIHAPRPHPRAHGHGHGRRGWEGHERHAYRYGPHGDLDRDGIPNQYDRDRDGDGVRNRHDRMPDNGWRY